MNLNPRLAENRLYLLVGLLVLALAPAAAGYVYYGIDLPNETLHWIPSVLAPQDQICGPGGCSMSCADYDPDTICAEFTSVGGEVFATCCILEWAAYSTSFNVCVEEVSIVRDGGPLE